MPDTRRSSSRPPPVESLVVRVACPAKPEGYGLHMPAETDAESARARVAREAMRWAYMLRSRRRWVRDSRARERNEQEARSALAAIGLREAEVAALGKERRIVVRVPWNGDESMHWESRIFPWEYVIAAATRRERLAGSADGKARPVTVMRELLLQTPEVPRAPDPARLFDGGLRLLFVECLPPELREHWSVSSEQARLKHVLDGCHGADVHVISWPTLGELTSALAELRPQFVHFAGLDSHQGLRELRTYLGAEALVDIGPPRAGPAAGGSKQAGDGLPHGLQRVTDVVADTRLMVDGVLLRGDALARSGTGLPGAGEGGDDGALKRSYPRLVPAHDLALAMKASGHCSWLVSFNIWNSAARVAPLVVAERGALAALGFQDLFDDALAEFVHALMLEKLLRFGWNLPEAFEAMWLEVRKLPESLDATGITLWAGRPVLEPPRTSGSAGTPVAPRERSSTAEVRVEVKPYAELNYAVLHNAQPLFEKFVLECDDPASRPELDVEVAVHMGAETARYRRRLMLNTRRIALTHEVHVPLTAALARAAREAIGSSVEVEVRQGERTLYRDSHRLRLLPVDQWRDNRRDGRWLPSFVQPRDPAVAAALEQAQRYVRVLRDDPNAGFEGYQLARAGDEESLRGVDRQVEAIWATLLHDWKLGYVNPPPAYSGALDSQRLRLPSTVKQHRAGTCIDLALLFAACLELVDIYPVIFLLEGHALPGWWRHADYRDEYAEMPRENVAEIGEPDVGGNAMANAQIVAWHTGKASWPEVRRWIRQRKLVPIETVRLTEHCGFVEAIEAGVEALAERRDFDSMLDIVTARLENVTPLPVREE